MAEGVRAALATRESAASVFGVPPEALHRHYECICPQPLYEAYSDCPIHGHAAMIGKVS